MANEKPIPELSIAGETEFYWEASQAEKLLVHYCEECETHIFPPRLACPHCLSNELTQVESSGRGEVYTFSTVYHPPSETWKDDVPYTIAYVKLEEGVYIFSRVVNADPEDLHIGMPVTVAFDHISEDVTLPVFEPTK